MLFVTATQAQPPEPLPTPVAEASPTPAPSEELEATPTPQPTPASTGSSLESGEMQPPAEAQPVPTPQPTPSSSTLKQSDVSAAPSSELSFQLIYPTGNPLASPAPASSELVFNGSNPGLLTVECRVQVTPDTQENRARLADKLRFTIEPIGTSHASGDITSIRWDTPWVVYTDGRSSRYGKGVYNASTGTFNATATFRGLPLNNSDFGQKNVKVEWRSAGGSNGSTIGQDSTVVEVFFSRDETNHPGMSLNAVSTDYGSAGVGAAARCPNWFYYYTQAIGDNENNERGINERYAGFGQPGLQGRAPAVRFYQNDYAGRYGRTLIYDYAILTDTVKSGLPSGQTTTGIDTFRDKVVHERHHALQQSLHWTNRAFNYSRQPDDDVSSRSWSFNLGINPNGLDASPNGRKFNHNGLDVNPRNDVFDAEAPSANTFLDGDIEYAAYSAENNVENALAHRDWAFPGKQHGTINDFND